jgi:hypothetical protein
MRTCIVMWHAKQGDVHLKPNKHTEFRGHYSVSAAPTPQMSRCATAHVNNQRSHRADPCCIFRRDAASSRGVVVVVVVVTAERCHGGSSGGCHDDSSSGMGRGDGVRCRSGGGCRCSADVTRRTTYHDRHSPPCRCSCQRRRARATINIQ